ncbi:Choline/ethanolamine kinase-like protein, partial [Leptotrombidium deliense]
MTFDKEVNEKVANICKEFLGGQWLQAKVEDITIKPIIVGFANRTFHCILKNSSKANETEDNEIPNEAVVKLYGNELVGKDSVIKVIGEAAEAVVLYKLSTLNMSPKLYGVFAGGRVEGYVEV